MVLGRFQNVFQPTKEKIEVAIHVAGKEEFTMVTTDALTGGPSKSFLPWVCPLLATITTNFLVEEDKKDYHCYNIMLLSSNPTHVANHLISFFFCFSALLLLDL